MRFSFGSLFFVICAPIIGESECRVRNKKFYCLISASDYDYRLHVFVYESAVATATDVRVV